ncbi:hypothetical protein DID88_010368 [Monilinia fructigena]|uniref:Uncharacterized protein n=1 Tax=Monilinia fructigena TaxID=38457 RepID=A0A395ISF9_9HELO|nr:hypothetical protein DID88_010368 [Monilinia fructigena]
MSFMIPYYMDHEHQLTLPDSQMTLPLSHPEELYTHFVPLDLEDYLHKIPARQQSKDDLLNHRNYEPLLRPNLTASERFSYQWRTAVTLTHECSHAMDKLSEFFRAKRNNALKNWHTRRSGKQEEELQSILEYNATLKERLQAVAVAAYSAAIVPGNQSANVDAAAEIERSMRRINMI